MRGRFDFEYLKQTDVLDLINFQSISSHQFGTVPLAHTISLILNKMGTMKDLTTEEDLGTCTIIAHNLVLVARHAVEGRDVRNLNVSFGYTKFDGSIFNAGHTNFDRIIEENALCDYAIIRLKEPLGSHLGFVSLDIGSPSTTELALLHYPLEKPLKVFVHTFDQTPYQTDCLLTNHDSDYLSSG